MMATPSSNTSRNGRVSFSGGTASLLLERSRLSSGNRRHTPDSEALVSSDEEHGQSIPSQSQSLAFRRASTSRPQTSWLSDIGQPQPARKYSLGVISLTSGNSQPPTPSSETTPRLTTTLQSSSSSTTGFQPSIWNSDRKQPPSRLTEVAQSPSSGSREQLVGSPLERGNFGIGVEIPLDPVFRSGQRAMSFSVGQADQLSRVRTGITRKNSAGGLGIGHGLAQLREDEDDVASFIDDSSDAGVPLPSDADSEQNAFRRALTRQRTMPAGATNLPAGRTSLQARSMSFRLPDYAVEEEDLTAPAWSTNSNFERTVNGGLESRRHSLAGVPPRGRAVSFAPTRLQEELSPQSPTSNEEHVLHHISSNELIAAPVSEVDHATVYNFAKSYFNGFAVDARYTAYHLRNAQHLPSRNILYWVQFKCERGGPYYVVEGSGLRPKKGDMVIVEGDRGQDLGTIHACDISPTQVRELRQEFKYRHFRWLIDFSRTARTNPQVRWAISKIDAKTAAAEHPSNFHQGEDAKPKLIKRLAFFHEVQNLVNKEGIEAKAKRACQQKVVDHQLQMEILDAEYQWDNKKLTFYYFAESYVNFNELVSDLFKLFKTRIWMSAVNPASFASSSPTHAIAQPQSTLRNHMPSQAQGAPSAFPPSTVPYGQQSPAGFDSVGGFGSAPYNQAPFGYDGAFNDATTNPSPLGNPYSSPWPAPTTNNVATAPNGNGSNPWPRRQPAPGPQYAQYNAPSARAVAPSMWSTPPEAMMNGPSLNASMPTFVPPRNGHNSSQNESLAAWYAAFANMNIDPQAAPSRTTA